MLTIKKYEDAFPRVCRWRVLTSWN